MHDGFFHPPFLALCGAAPRSGYSSTLKRAPARSSALQRAPARSRVLQRTPANSSALALRSVSHARAPREAKRARICQWVRWRSTECRGYLVGAGPMRRQQGAKGDQRRIGALLRDGCCGAHVRSSGLKHTPRCQELLPLLVPLGSPGGRVAAPPASQLSTVHPAAWSAGRAIS